MLTKKNLIFLGGPGAGKGTVSNEMIKKYGVAHISTGDILRAEVAKGTPAGKEAGAIMKSGGLVPDAMVCGMVGERLKEPDCEKGFILDGFPRTIPQAEALDNMGIEIDKVIDIEVPDEVIVTRMSGRRVCEKCGRPYHTESLKPKVEGICDDCAGALIQRKDDHPDTVKARLEIYHNETEPLKGYYEKQGKLFVVEGQNSVEETTKATFEALEA